jgi:hypothetical protein
LKSSGVTITSEQTISPEGINNGWKFEKTAASYKSIGQNYTSSSETTFSIFAKKGTLSVITLLANINSGTNLYQRFDLENGIVSTGSGMSSSNIEEYGNGWYRCSSTFTNTNVQALDYFPDFAENEAGFIYIYGGQAEVGSYLTSYIKTTTSAVTRSAETANGSGDASTFNDSEGVLMAEISALADDLNIEAISINANNADNRLALFKWNVSNRLQIRVNINGATLIDAGVSVSNIEDLNKISLKYKSGDYALWINGFEVYVNSLADTPIGLSNLSFDSNGSNGVPFKGKTKQIQYYNSALTDSELEKISSWTSFTDMAQGQLYTIE